MMPISTAPNAIVYSSGFIPITAMMRYGIVLDVVAFVVIVAVVLLLGPGPDSLTRTSATPRTATGRDACAGLVRSQSLRCRQRAAPRGTRGRRPEVPAAPRLASRGRPADAGALRGSPRWQAPCLHRPGRCARSATADCSATTAGERLARRSRPPAGRWPRPRPRSLRPASRSASLRTAAFWLAASLAAFCARSRLSSAWLSASR